MMSKCKWVLLGLGIAAAGFLILKKAGMLKMKYIGVYDAEDDFYEGDINCCCCGGEKPDAVEKTPEKEETSASIEIEVKPPVDDVI